MRLSLAKEAVKAAWSVGRVPLLVGEPGIGKSEAVFQATADVGRQVWDVWNLVQENPVELKGYGFPDREAGVTRILPLARVKALTEYPPGVIFFDELGQATPVTMCAAAPALLKDPTGRRRFGSTYVDVDHYLAAATNAREHRSLVNALPDFFASRLTELPVEFHFDDWDAWAAAHGIHDFVLGYGRANRDSIHHHVAGKRSPLARSWTFVSDFERLPIQDSTKRALIEGTIGPEATAKYWKLRDSVHLLPRMEDILQGRGGKIPDEKGLQFLVVTALAARTTPANIGHVLAYLKPFGEEFADLYMTDCRRKDPKNALLNIRAVQE